MNKPSLPAFREFMVLPFECGSNSGDEIYSWTISGHGANDVYFFELFFI